MTVAKLNWELRILEMAMQSLRAKVDTLLAKEQEATVEGRPMQFTDLKGLWEGADFSFEDIQAAEYKVPEDLL